MVHTGIGYGGYAAAFALALFFAWPIFEYGVYAVADGRLTVTRRDARDATCSA